MLFYTQPKVEIVKSLLHAKEKDTAAPQSGVFDFNAKIYFRHLFDRLNMCYNDIVIGFNGIGAGLGRMREVAIIADSLPPRDCYFNQKALL